MNNTITEKLGTEPVGKLFLRLSIPSLLAMLVNLLYNVVDRIYLGNMPGSGSLALTGVGICFPIITIISSFALLFGQGGAPRASIALGEKNKEKAENLLGNSFSLLVISAVILTAGVWIFSERLLWLFGASENTIQYALPYMHIYGSFSVFVMISFGLNTYITAQGFTKYSMLTVLAGAVCNIALDPLFIFVFNMGVRGAAYATGISQALSCLLVMLFLTGKKTNLKIQYKHMKLNASLIGSIVSLGVSPFIMHSTEAAINISFNYSFQQYGGDIAVGVMTIAATVMQIVFMIPQSMAQGAQPIISYNFGAKNADRFKKIVKITIFTGFFISLFLWSLVEIMPQVFAGIFGAEGEILEMSRWALRLYLAVGAIFGFQGGIQQTFVATGQAAVSLFIACLRKLILLIPLIFILPGFFDDKVFAVFLAEPIADLVSVIIASLIFIYKLPRLVRSLQQ